MKEKVRREKNTNELKHFCIDFIKLALLSLVNDVTAVEGINSASAHHSICYIVARSFVT